MNVAAETRSAVESAPFLHRALRAGVVNYTAAAEVLDIDGESEAIAAALRRYAAELDPIEPDERSVTVRMQRGVSVVDADRDEESEVSADATLWAVAGTVIDSSGGDATALVCTGAIDSALFATIFSRLHTAAIEPIAAGFAHADTTEATDGTAVVVVGRREAIDTLRLIESAAETHQT
ncbi:DUF7523 family protein [Halalkalirubrum salinum]|uniref:DUF7523 family protein n=1 Tax=Halalkalirubrum salinum TaxID=2563889 RepID=UPI0010FB4F0F|nr:hypothetical protein [Halalkalirubrum salinum]